MGHINYGHALVDRKGITQSVAQRDAGALTGNLTGWEVFPLPMDDRFVATLKRGRHVPSRPGISFRASLHLRSVGDTYVDVSRWAKGVVWINGHNLGRYWEIGPQLRLFCPAPWLRHGHNEILIFDLHQTEAAPITLEPTLQ